MGKQSTLANAFQAEWLKIKGLGLLTLAIIFGMLIPAMLFAIEMYSEDARSYDGLPMNAATVRIRETLSQFGNFFMLLLIIIAATRITQIDHKNNGWTFLETQPVSKLNIYSAKFLVLTVLTSTMLAVYFLSSILFANLVLLIFPQEGLQMGVDVYWLFQTVVRLFVLSLCIISFQLMLSTIIPGFVWPFAIGFVGFVINVVAVVRNETYDFIPYNNVSTGLSFKDSFKLNHFFNYTEYLSLFWTVLFFSVGYFWYSRRGFKSAFLRTTKAKVFSAAGIVLFLGLYLFITKPVHPQKLADRTVISGSIQSPKPIKNITIISTEFNDEIAEIPVQNGLFQWESKDNIPFAEYGIKYDGKFYPFIFSRGDDIHFDIKTDAKQSEVVVKGTRKAEDLYGRKEDASSNFYNYVVPAKAYTDDPTMFYKEARKEWDDKLKKLNSFRTAENIYFADDYKQYQTQKSATKMLSAIYDYQKMTSFTDKKFAAERSFLSELEKAIQKPSPLLYSSDLYKSWKLKELLPKEGTANPDSILFAKLKAMPAGVAKDQLLSTHLIATTTLENDEARRNSIYREHIDGVKNPKFKQLVAKNVEILNNQQRGKAFPAMTFEEVDGSKAALSEFKGKFVVIDFWATWCGPCKETSPVFAYQAKNNKFNKNVVFLAISIDEDRNKWKLDLKNTQSNVKQWWVPNRNALKELGVNEIPRFMMLDPDGKIYNANMPRPNETNFVDIVEKATGNSSSFTIIR